MNILKQIKEFMYYKKHGYLPMDWYSYDSSNAMRAVKCLRRLRDDGRSGPGNLNYQPTGLDASQRASWADILSEMIFAWEEVLLASNWEFEEIVEVCGRERTSHIGVYALNEIGYNKEKQLCLLEKTFPAEKQYILRKHFRENEEYYINNQMFQVQTGEDEVRMKEGFRLYVEYYFNLWD
jgi:hypothetical protein